MIPPTMPPDNAPTHKSPDRDMGHARRREGTGDRRGQDRHQARLAVGRFEQVWVRTRMGPIKCGGQRAIRGLDTEHVCYRGHVQRNHLRLGLGPSQQELIHTVAFVFHATLAHS